MNDSEIQRLLEEQREIGKKLEQLLVNFRKDSAIRKTEDYISKRLQLADNYWVVLETNHSKLAPLKEALSDNSYFRAEFFETMEKVYRKLSTLLMEFNTESQATDAPRASTSANAVDDRAPVISKDEAKDKDESTISDQEENDQDDLHKLVRRQKGLMRFVTNIIQGVEARTTQHHTRPYYELKIKILMKYQEEMINNDQRIWEISTKEKPLGYDPDIFYELDCWVQDAIISLQERCSNQCELRSDPNQTSQQQSGPTKLPRITIPTFNGNYLHWTQFRELYTQLIHNQPISNIEKMFYLTSNLGGEARTLIQHLPISNENYEGAWGILKGRYDNNRLLVTALLNKLLSQATIQVESAAAIRTLHDTTRECLLGLKNLGLAVEEWDPLVVHIIIKKLDKGTHALYEQSLEAPRELDPLENVLKFLETRFQSLESLGRRNPNSGKDKYTQKVPHQLKSSSFMVTSSKGSCVVCKQKHPLYSCKIFLSKMPSSRLECLRKHNLCINCMKEGHLSKDCTLRGCKKCWGKHNTLVHLESVTRQIPQADSEIIQNQLPTPSKPHHLMHRDSHPSSINTHHQQPATLAAQVTRSERSYVLLSTVLVKLRNNEGSEVECRAILDSGSQLNFITDNLAKKLTLKGSLEPLHILGIGSGSQRTQKRVSVILQSRTSKFSIRIEAHTLPQITSYQPAQPLDITDWPIPDGVDLADPEFHRPGRIDLLLGAENFFQLLLNGQISLGSNLPILQNTQLGWVIAGRMQGRAPSQVMCGICSEDEEKLNEQIERFWRLEEADVTKTPLSPAEIKCETHFNQNVRRDQTGRFIVRLPFAQDPTNLGESKDIALNRFYSLERKLNRNPELKQQYVEFIQEYGALGHMERTDWEQLSSPYFFLPHHCVLKPESSTTKLRVVFNGSMKTSSNASLNDLLHTGPTVQDELFSILLRFRLPRYAFTADIEKMYRQIIVDENDRKFQLIIWRDDPTKQLECYQLCTVTYGVRTAPYLATKCLQRLAAQTADQWPLGSTVLARDFYVDDVMTGANTLREALEVQDQLIKTLQSGGFKLRKWCANHKILMENIDIEDRAPELELHDDAECHVKTLGITWLPRSDEFAIKTHWQEEELVTKRKVLSDIAHLFDPLGIMSPVVVTAKIFLQRLWSLKLDWDTELPPEYNHKWIKFRRELSTLNDIRIPRHVFSDNLPKLMQLHAFSDASEKAFGAAIYIRAILPNRVVITRLLCAKCKVAPRKVVTLPRLELCAAKLTAELMHRVRRDLKWDQPCYYWTDSEIVLAWLNSPSSSYYTFVANRVAAIQEITTVDQWCHVSSIHNPADLVSRGISPEKLKNSSLWFYGPLFLHGSEDSWPSKPTNLHTDLERRQAKTALTVASNTTHILDSVDHRNSFNHLQRIIAYIVRFARNCRQQPNQRKGGLLSVVELEDALTLIIKEVQRRGFEEDLANLQRSGHVNANSSLSSLSPFLDERGVIRVGGRLEESKLPYDAKHPILLPYDRNITKLLMIQIHNTNSHVGAQTLLSITRQRFWPIKGKTIARSIIQGCMKCAKFKPKLLEQFMGNLPAHRVQPARPFINVGIDFCGPFWIHFNIRGKRPQKCYVAIFCCFATKAVHIEVVSNLSTEAFIGALKRFTSRRGNCRNIYCDNATNFLGASNQHRELQQIIYARESEDKISHFCTKKGIDFHFIPPRAPHFGGLWEAAVKSAKHLFQKSVAAASLTHEELVTIMTEIEAILNSRPLTPMSSSPNDLCALTPGHFLIGEPLTSTLDPHAHSTKGSLSKGWKQVTELKDQFWHRWTKEYLCELQHRYKWKEHCNNVQPGTMVVIRDANLPTLSWQLGRIVKTIKGDDGLVRVADVKTASGVLRRPIHILAPLPMEQEQDLPNTQELPCSPSHPSKQQHVSTDISHEKDDEVASTSTAPPKRRRCAISAISLVLFTCLIVPILGEGQVSISPFKNQPGVYFEGLGSTHLISNEWNLVVYYEMASYWNEFKNIENGIVTLSTVCNSTKDSQICTQTVRQFLGILSELRNNNKLLSEGLHTRKRRAPLDIIGNLAHSLFGVLDSTYAERMSQIISNLEGNQEHLQELLRNHTSIIDSTVNIIRKSDESVKRQLQEFENYINQGMSQLNAVNMELHEQKVTEMFNTLSVRLILAITSYQRMQSLLMDVIIDTHHGKVNPLLLAPDQLRSQLIVIKENLPSTLRLPTNQNNLLELYSLMTVEVRVTRIRTIFKIKLPLFSYEPFELLRIVPIPVLINGSFLVIEPSSEFLIVNLHRDQYYPLSGQEMAMCSTIRRSTHMCKQHHPLYRRGSNISSCELGLLTNSRQPSNCKISKSDTTHRWIQLLNPNHWIYVTKGETAINIICGDTVTQRILSGSGLLNISAGCTIKDEGTTIQAHNLYPSSLKTSFVPSKNLTDVLKPFEAEEIWYQPHKYQTNITDDINELKTKLKHLHSVEGFKFKADQHVIHQFSIGYIGLFIAIILTTYLIWNYCAKRHSNIRRQHPIPAPRTVPEFSIRAETEEILELDVQGGGRC